MRSSGAVSVGEAHRPAWRAGDTVQLGVVTFSHAVQHIYVAALALTYPYVVAEFGLSYRTLGILLGVAGLVGGLLQAAAGMVRRVSARVLLVGQNVGLAIAALLAAVAPGFATFSAARMVGAFSAWPQHPVGSAYLAERYPQRRGLVLSWHTTGGSIGTFLVPLAAAGLITYFGWRSTLAVFAAAMLVGAGLVFAFLRTARSRAAAPNAADAAEEPAEPAEQPPPSAERASSGVALRSLLRRRTVVAVLVASTIAAAGRGLGALTTYVPAYLSSDLGLGPTTVSAVFAVLVLGSIIGPVLAGQLSDRLGRRRVLVTVYLVGAAALAGFVLIGSVLVALTIMALLVGVFAYAESPLLQSLFADAAEGAEQRSAFGCYFAIAYGVGSLWLTVLGAIISAAGFRAAFFTMAASFVAAALTVVGVRPRVAS